MKTKLMIITNKSQSRFADQIGHSDHETEGQKYRVAKYEMKNGKWVRRNPKNDGFGSDLESLKKMYPEADLGRGVK